MTLVDVDKSGEQRNNPQPNSSDGVAQRMAHQTVSSQYQSPGVPVTSKLQQVGKTIIANDGTTNKVALGYNPGLNQWGLAVAKDGIDVMTNTDPANLIFNSAQDTFKVVKILTGTFATVVLSTPANTTQVGQTVVTIPHGLSFIPTVLPYGNIFIYNGGSYIQQYSLLPYTDFGFYGTTLNNYRVITYAIVADATNIYAAMTVNSSSTVTLTNSNYLGGAFKVYLLQETAN